MAEVYANHALTLTGPCTAGFAVTPSDSTVFEQPPRELYILTSGNLAIVMMNDFTVTLPVTAGQTLFYRVKKVNATNTTATCCAFY